jgi:hypothetical protein
MAELVHERAVTLVGPDGTAYETVRVYAEPNGRTTWAGWLEFLPADGGPSLATDVETTQSNVEAVAYWATGLEPIFFEGALARARSRPATGTAGTMDAPRGPVPSRTHSGEAGVARLRVESMDPAAPLGLMRTRTLAPGTRRRIRDGGVLVYEGTRREPTADQPGAYDFVAQFGSRNAAGVMANTLWSDLHGLGARLFVDEEEIELTNSAIKDALMAAQLT